MKKEKYKVGLKIDDRLIKWIDEGLTLNEVRIIDYLFKSTKDPLGLKKINLKILSKNLKLAYITTKKIIKKLKGRYITAFYNQDGIYKHFYFRPLGKNLYYLWLGAEKIILSKRKGGKRREGSLKNKPREDKTNQ